MHSAKFFTWKKVVFFTLHKISNSPANGFATHVTINSTVVQFPATLSTGLERTNNCKLKCNKKAITIKTWI